VDKRDSYSKAVCGPGGINCPCCRTGDKREAKRLNARGKRRKARAALAREARTA
jgi:hypothetical protein